MNGHIERIGLTPVYQPANLDDHTVDIVLVHGLFGHPEDSWTCNKACEVDPTASDRLETSDGPDRKRPKLRANKKELFQKVFWPRDLLPQLFPTARVMIWGYDVQIERFFSSTSKATIFQHAETLLSDLTRLRSTPPEKSKPIIFIAHSLGGIIVKDALGLSRMEGTHLKEILPATVGVVFLGTPHHGSNTASLGKIAFELSRVFLQNPNMQILRDLEVNSETLERISRSFGQVLASERVKVHSFREELETKGVKIVEDFSSQIGYFAETRDTLHANHRDMAKFSSLTDPNFQRFDNVLRRWIKDMPSRPEIAVPLHTAAKVDPDGLVFDEEYFECLRSLDVEEARSRVQSVKKAYPSTYDWLYGDSISFSRWLEGKEISPKYWIQGKPGSGKSTLMKYALNSERTHHHLSTFQDGEWLVAGYFFHDRGTDTQKSVRGFLQEILYQAVSGQKEVFPSIQPLFSKYRQASSFRESTGSDGPKAGDRIWTINTVQQALVSIFSSSTSNINLCLFVDALDEHDGDHRELLSALDCFTRCFEKSRLKLRLCLAGRPENIFKDAFKDYPSFSIHENTVSDIRKYTQGRLSKEAKVALYDGEKMKLDSLAKSIIERAFGVFLWVRLVIDELSEGLCDGDTIEELQDQLSQIPNELEDLYTRALRRRRRTSSRAIARQRYEAYVMFQIAIDCIEPLDIDDFLKVVLYLTTKLKSLPGSDILSRDQLERRLNGRSAGLLEAPNDGISNPPLVQFIHQTVKEFMYTYGGRQLIREGIHDQPEQSGKMLVFRYILGAFEHWDQDFFGDSQKMFACDRFRPYAEAIEREESVCVADYFEPVFWALRKPSQVNLLRWFCDHGNAGDRSILARAKLYHRLRLGLLHVYSYCELPLSCRRCLQLACGEITEDSIIELLKSEYSTGTEYLSVWRILLAAGISDHLSHDSLEDLKSRVQMYDPGRASQAYTPIDECGAELYLSKGSDSGLSSSRDNGQESLEVGKEASKESVEASDGKVESSEREEAASGRIEQGLEEKAELSELIGRAEPGLEGEEELSDDSWHSPSGGQWLLKQVSDVAVMDVN